MSLNICAFGLRQTINMVVEVKQLKAPIMADWEKLLGISDFTEKKWDYSISVAVSVTY